MVKFGYTPDGRIIDVRDTFSAFNEPSEPIPAEITALTGITDEMVAGHSIDEAAVNAFVDDSVVLVIAHNVDSIGSFPNATGPSSSARRGHVPRPRSSGGSTASMERSSATF
ncbi:hypothetical protein [Bradyrhizobium sp. 163]|uniref:hypothetical protein n=1 Tax=unclassified Bradyrhizobium TaxID=2631580 RepID=UPI00320851E4